MTFYLIERMNFFLVLVVYIVSTIVTQISDDM